MCFWGFGWTFQGAQHMSEKGFRGEVNSGMSDTENVPARARLCYVDDSRTSAYVVKRLLQPFGYQVDHFASAEPAFVALVQENYDLLLTDLKVSPKGMDGDDLIRTLRQSGHAQLSNLPIIVITGATDAEALVGVYDAGANQVMKKPVDADELDGHIQRLLATVPHAEPTPVEPALPKMDRRASDNTVVTLHAAQRPTRDPEPPVIHPTQESVPSAETDVPAADETKPVADTAEHVISAEPAPLDPHVLLASDAVDDSSILRAMEASAEPIIIADDDKKPGEEKPPTEVIIEPPHSAEKSEEEIVIIEPDVRKDRAAHFGTELNDDNILSEIEQYPLVTEQRRGLFSHFPGVHMLQSLIELIGVRGLIMRTLAAVAILIVALLGWNVYFNQGLAVDVVLVETGEIFQSITVPGRVVSKQRVNVSSARAGRLVKILVKEGDKVAQGQVLAKIDDRELLSRLTRTKANLSAAREDIVLAQRTLDRLRKAHKKGAVARRFVEDAEVDLRAARTKAGIVVEEVRSATLDFDNQKITAAFAGTVTARFAEIGQWVGPTETLFTLVDESQREIEVRVDAADSVAIDVGQVVVVSSDAFPGLEWQESVVRLGTEAGNNNNTNSVKVYVSLGGDAPVLRYGQQVDADIRTAWNPSTLKVPFEALISRDGQTMVAVVNNGSVRMKVVETGIEDFAMAEIKQGLNSGEMVILSKGVVLQNGDKVHPRQDNE